MTNKTTAALKLAEEALEGWKEYDTWTDQQMWNDDDEEALAAIREALAEPVAWKRESDGALFRFEVHEGLTPLYAPSVSVEAEWIETNKALAKEIIEQRNQYLDMLAEAVDLSVKAEREACAKVVESGVLGHGECAASIRARGEK